MMGSGAADSVAPPTLAPQVTIDESPGSKRGQCYVSASAGRMPNMGQKVLNIQTNEGKDTTVLYQIAEVSRPLTSVSATCDRGNWVVYTPQGGFILNCQTGERTSFERSGGIYELDLWMRDEDNHGSYSTSSFPPAGLLSVRVPVKENAFLRKSRSPFQKGTSRSLCTTQKSKYEELER